MASKVAFKRLHTLDPAVVEEVNKRLLGGDTPSNVAKYLQEELGLLTDLKPGSVKKNLERYRSVDLQAAVVQEIVEKVKGKNVANTHKRLIALDEMELICTIQKTRVEKLLLKEQSLPGGILLKQTTDELRLLKEATTELSKMQLETGIGMKRAPKTVHGMVTNEEGETRQFTWTEEADKLLAIADTRIAGEKGKVIDHEAAEDIA
jgi:hypothetical protein